MICKECSTPLIGRQKQFCSNSCKNKVNGRRTGGRNNQRVELICQFCGNKYELPPSQAKVSRHCSRKCHNTVISREWKHSGENSPLWKGDKVGYHGMHGWHLKNWVKSGICEHCKLIKKTDWAQKKGQPLVRGDKTKWLELCRSCHTTYDGKVKYLRKTYVR